VHIGGPSFRIFYIGPLGKGSTTLQRMRSLEELGHILIPFDVNPYTNCGNRIKRSIVHRSVCGPPVSTLNRDIQKAVSSIQYDWAWIDKGTWVYPETVNALKRHKDTLVVHYTPDPAIVFHKTRHFMRSIPYYDALITTKSYEIQKYEENGARHVIYTQKGYDPYIFKPYDVHSDTRQRLESDVCFVGHCERHYRRRILAVSKAVENVAVWGQQWGPYCMLYPQIKRVYRGPGIWHIDYAKALSCAKIGLGLLSKLAPDQSTARTYEITSCGTFMLAERTGEHLELFEEGKEAEFFDSDEEFLDKVKYYLAYDEERKRIARAGRERCLNSGYSIHNRLKNVIDKIVTLLQ